jgi:class 3 adenylate cyclase
MAGCSILIDEATRTELDERIEVNALGKVAFKGKAAEVEVYAVEREKCK